MKKVIVGLTLMLGVCVAGCLLARYCSGGALLLFGRTCYPVHDQACHGDAEES